MNSIDIILILLVGLSTVGGLASGFSRLVVGLASTITGIFLGFWFYGVVAAPLMPYVSRREVANALGFVIILVVCVIAGALLGRLLASLFKWVGLTWMDRLLGGLVGFARGVLIAVALVTVVLACAPSPLPHVIVESRLMPYVLQASRALAAVTPKEVKDAFDDAADKVRDIWNKQKEFKPQSPSESKV